MHTNGVSNGAAAGAVVRAKWESIPSDINMKALKGTVKRWKVTVRRLPVSEGGKGPDDGISAFEFYIYGNTEVNALKLVQGGTFRHPARPLEPAAPIVSWADVFEAEVSDDAIPAKLVHDMGHRETSKG
jgi:hypothetical protein